MDLSLFNDGRGRGVSHAQTYAEMLDQIVPAVTIN